MAATDVSLAHPGRPVGRDPVGEDLDAADLQLLVAEAASGSRDGAARPEVGQRVGAVLAEQVEDVHPHLQTRRVQQVLVDADALRAQEPALIAIPPGTEGRLCHAGDAQGRSSLESGRDRLPLLRPGQRRDEAHHHCGGELDAGYPSAHRSPGPSRCRRRRARVSRHRYPPVPEPCCSPTPCARRSRSARPGCRATPRRAATVEAETGVGQHTPPGSRRPSRCRAPTPPGTDRDLRRTCSTMSLTDRTLG